MASANVKRERDMMRRINVVVACKSERFADILKAAKIDPRTGLRFRNFSGMSFVGENLQGFNFTGSNLCNCDFENALIAGARFDQARIGQFLPAQSAHSSVPQLHITDLAKAKDWRSNIRSDWEPAEPRTTDDHLPIGAVFQDVHIAPEMIVLPTFGPWSGPSTEAIRRISMSRYSVGKHKRSMLFEGKKIAVPSEPLWSRNSALEYCKKLSIKAGRIYRLPTRRELILACAAGPHFSLSELHQVNGFGVSLHHGESDLPVRDLAAEHFRSEYAEWCSDDDAPIYMTGEPLAK